MRVEIICLLVLFAVALAVYMAHGMVKNRMLRAIFKKGSSAAGVVKAVKNKQGGARVFVVELSREGETLSLETQNKSYSLAVKQGDLVDLLYFEGKVVVANERCPDVSSDIISSVIGVALYAFIVYFALKRFG